MRIRLREFSAAWRGVFGGLSKMKYGELPAHTTLGVFLYCEECGEQYSATRGDYFMVPDSREITCGNQPDGRNSPRCGYPLILASEHKTIVPL
jgi:hypothetical protein